MTKPREDSALAEGFYWMAEKLAWGYEDVEPNLVEAYNLFRQAGDLGFSDALIRVGELQEHGKGCGPSRSLLGRDFHSHFAPRSHFAFTPAQIDLQWWRQQPDLSPLTFRLVEPNFSWKVPLTLVPHYYLRELIRLAKSANSGSPILRKRNVTFF